MRRTAWAWLALSSLLPASARAATRPHYGGTLAVELSTAFSTLDSTDFPAGIAQPIAETLLRLNSQGEVEPWLAVAWQADADRKRWRFSLRPKVTFHDGEPLTGPSAAPLLLAPLKKTYPDVAITAGGQALVIRSDRAMPDLLSDLANARTAIIRRSESNPSIGTGPFRVTGWEPGRKLNLTAFDDYWGGRPFLDAVAINMASTRANGDVFDVPFSATRRILAERTRLWSSPVEELVALVGTGMQPAALKAIALAIDREPLVNVLTQRRGEAAFGLLPEWLSGYAFLFRTAPDAGRARQSAALLRLGTLTLSYAASDSFARAAAERISLNTRDAGINLQPTPNANGNLRLARWRVESANVAVELQRLAGLLGVSETPALDAANPTALYEAERALLETQRVIPLVYLPVIYGMSPRVHGSDAGFALRLESLWVDP
ncbi:MAG: ABC transporter substrate-binding protein [Bryobacteraceae bacterium]